MLTSSAVKDWEPFSHLMNYSRLKNCAPSGPLCQEKLGMGQDCTPSADAYSLSFHVLHAKSVFWSLFRGKRRRKSKIVGKEEEQNVSSRPNLHLSLLTHHFPSLSLLLSLPAPPPFISSSLSDFFFVLPPPSPLRCIRFTVLYLPSLCKILLALFSSFALLRLSSRFFPPQQQLWRGQMR